MSAHGQRRGPAHEGGLAPLPALLLLWTASAIGLAAAGAALLAYVARYWWPFDLLSHFRAQYLAALVVVTLYFSLAVVSPSAVQAMPAIGEDAEVTTPDAYSAKPSDTDDGEAR